jgi:16S rRNA (guanine527-N7)-methyltransferase
MTCLNNLLGYSFPFCNKETKLIFPKGRSYNDELDEAKKCWNFHLNIQKNEVCEDGVVLIIENLRRKK